MVLGVLGSVLFFASGAMVFSDFENRHIIQDRMLRSRRVRNVNASLSVIPEGDKVIVTYFERRDGKYGLPYREDVRFDAITQDEDAHRHVQDLKQRVSRANNPEEQASQEARVLASALR
jgi:hypothetical protein